MCPSDPAHGRLYEWDNGWMCPHEDHYGRPKSHPLGVAPTSRNIFTYEEAIG